MGIGSITVKVSIEDTWVRRSLALLMIKYFIMKLILSAEKHNDWINKEADKIASRTRHHILIDGKKYKKVRKNNDKNRKHRTKAKRDSLSV